jgi:palmitoyl-protein thioesterase
MVRSFLFLAAVAAADELPPNLQAFINLANDDPEAAVAEIKASPLAAIVREVEVPEEEGAGTALPTVVGHGMGDSCFNPGMQSITRRIGKTTGSYARCIPTAGNILTDTIDGFLKNMDDSIDYWADKIKNDPKLANGFNCIGFSQGNSQCRGYIERYNGMPGYPTVKNFISVHGTVMGVAAFPGCFQQGKPLGLLCKAFSEVLGDLAYNPLVQGILYQANYFRDATKAHGAGYKAFSQIAQWNNEGNKVNAQYKENFLKVEKFAMVKAAQDSMVYPNEAEQWGQIKDDSSTIQTMKETKFYQDDLFGLKTADEAGKIFMESTSGDHLQFSDAELDSWVTKYFIGNSDVQV